MTDIIVIRLYPKQGEFFLGQDRMTAFIGGVGSGKTYAGAVKALSRARRPGTLGMVVSPTYTMLKDVTMRTFRQLAGDAIAGENKSDYSMKIANGGEVLFRSADNPERLRGANLNWAWIDEAAQCQSGTWEILIGRLRADGRAGECWITSTPKGRNWLYKLRDEITMYKASTHDNPHLAPEFISSLERAYSGEFARQELHGEFASLEGLVYSFRRDAHVRERNAAEMKQFTLCVDEGYTNPAVILACGIDGDGRWHIFEEWYHTEKLQADVVAACAEFYERYHAGLIAVDAAAAGLIADMKDAGLPASPHKGRVLDGIRKIQNMLQVQGDGLPRLTVDPACVNMIDEFEAYVWKEGKDEPVKMMDHALDALRYGLETDSVWWTT